MTAPEPLPPNERRARNVGIGCFTVFAGFVSMAMVGVLVSVIVAGVTKAPRCADIPSCNWYIYAVVGGVFGAVSLPVLVLRRLNSPPRGDGETPKV